MDSESSEEHVTEHERMKKKDLEESMAYVLLQSFLLLCLLRSVLVVLLKAAVLCFHSFAKAAAL